jgi:hypothetical protein
MDTSRPSTGRGRREWMLHSIFDRITLSDDDINRHVQDFLTKEAETTGVGKTAGAHRDRIKEFGVWTVKARWNSSVGGCETIILKCPMAYRCRCDYQIRIWWSPTQVVVEISGHHTRDSHVEADKEVGLKMQEKIVIKERVKAAPLASGTDIRRSLLDASPEKQINQARIG